MRVVLALSLIAGLGQAQIVPRNRITLNGGWARQSVNATPPYVQTAAAPGISYGYRALPHVEFEAGLFIVPHPSPDFCGSFGCHDVDDRYYWIPFGARFLLPLQRDRLELSAGGGGLYNKYTLGNPLSGGGPISYEGWGGYFSGAAAAALDRGRHLWLGTSPRFFLGHTRYRQRDRWLTIAGELSFRF
jgi:hypothetical protein